MAGLTHLAVGGLVRGFAPIALSVPSEGSDGSEIGAGGHPGPVMRAATKKAASVAWKELKGR